MITDADIEFANMTCADCRASGPLQCDEKSHRWLCDDCYEWPKKGVREDAMRQMAKLAERT